MTAELTHYKSLNINLNSTANLLQEEAEQFGSEIKEQVGSLEHQKQTLRQAVEDLEQELTKMQ